MQGIVIGIKGPLLYSRGSDGISWGIQLRLFIQQNLKLINTHSA